MDKIFVRSLIDLLLLGQWFSTYFMQQPVLQPNLT